ncbi:MAG TPA: YnfA family protein [Solirubrobacterales bacterium]
MTGRSISLFCAAALAEIGGAYLIWTGLREGKGPVAVAAGAVALVIYGLLAAQQPNSEFGRVLAAYGGVFIIGSLLWAVVFDGFYPDRFDLAGAIVCLMGIGVIMYAPR